MRKTMHFNSYVETQKLILWILSRGYFIKFVYTADDL